MSRLIDADAAIDALKELTANGTNKGMVFGEDAVHRIEILPSEQPETNCSEIPNNWIPCSERLPEINKEVLVTDGELCWVCSLFESQDIEDGLYQWEDNYGHWHEFETWVAWMPLPEPWKGEQK